MHGTSKASMMRSLVTSNRSISTILRLRELITSTLVVSMQKVCLTLMSLQTTGVTPWLISMSRQQCSPQRHPTFFAVHLQLSVRNPLRVVPMDTSTAMMATLRVLSTTRRPAATSSSTTTPIGSATRVTPQPKDTATCGRTKP